MTLVFLTAIILNGSRPHWYFRSRSSFLVCLNASKSTPSGNHVSTNRRGSDGRNSDFFLQGTELQDRFGRWIAGGKEGRMAIYRDAAMMVMRTPLLGVGLGNFEGVFNTMRVHSADQMARALHPESTWCGWPRKWCCGGYHHGSPVVHQFSNLLRKTLFLL